MPPKRKIICLIIYILLVLSNAQLPDFPNSSREDDFSGDLSRFFLEPLPLASEISGNVVGPNKMPGVNFTSIQDALNQSGANATIYVLSGEYNESINLSKPGVILKGVNTGEGAPVISAVGQTSTITVSASACAVDGFVVMNSGNPHAGIAVFSDGNTISNNVLANNLGYGIHLSQSSGNTIHGNRISHNGFDGIYLEGSSGNLITSNSATENGNNGLYLQDSDQNIIKENLLINNGQEGILLVNSNANSIIGNSYDSIREENSRDNVIEDNTVLNQEVTPGNDEPGPEPEPIPPGPIFFIRVGPEESIQSIQEAIDLISPGGTIEILSWEYHETLVVNKAGISLHGVNSGGGLPQVSGYGVVSTITLASSGIVIDGLVVTNSGNPHAGIDVRAQNCTIQGCQIRNNSGYGISISSSYGSRITENIIANNGLGGIIMESCQNNQIGRNSIASNGASNEGHGILLKTSSRNIISGNMATDSYCGIRLDSSSGNTISNNTATGIEDGIYLFFSNSNTIEYNTANGNGIYGIHLDSSTTTTSRTTPPQATPIPAFVSITPAATSSTRIPSTTAGPTQPIPGTRPQK